MFKGSQVMDLLAAHWCGHNGVTCYGTDWVYHTLSHVRAGKEGEGKGLDVEEHFNQKEEMKKRMTAIFACDKDIAGSFGCAFTPFHPLNATPRTSQGWGGGGGWGGDTSAFFNSSWLETWTTEATWLLGNPPCADSSARPDLNLKHGTIARERGEEWERGSGTMTICRPRFSRGGIDWWIFH